MSSFAHVRLAWWRCALQQLLLFATVTGCTERLDVLRVGPDDQEAMPNDAGRPGCDSCGVASLCSVERCRARAQVAGLGAGAEHTCVLAAGVLSCFGANAAGQLGQGDTMPRRFPTRVGRENDWLEIATGARHSCGLRSPGVLYCWGDNSQGQLGLGGSRPRSSPSQVGQEDAFTAIACGGDNCCALHDSGALFCWGANVDGTVGLNRSNSNAVGTPMQVGGDSRFLRVSVGSGHVCAIRGDSALLCWGRNTNGELGLGASRTVRRAPMRVGTASDWTSVSAGRHHTCAINAAGLLHCWGANEYAQCGVGREGPDGVPLVVDAPNVIDTGTAWLSVAAGGEHTCARRRGNELFCWGRNHLGQVGLPPVDAVEALSRIDTGLHLNRLALGEFHTCGLDTERALYCWGDNEQGQLGLGDVQIRREPTLVSQ